MINRIQSAEEFRELNLPEQYLKNLSEHSTDELLTIIERVVEVMLRHLQISEKEVEEFTEQVKERKMGELFEHFKDCDLPAERRKARAEGLAEGIKEGIKKGEELSLIKMVCKKLSKGKQISQIANELDEDASKVKIICQAAEAYAPTYDARQIWNSLHNKTEKQDMKS